MLKNALIYRIAQWDSSALVEIESRLEKARFEECGMTQTEALGWVEPRGKKHSGLLENIGGQLILRMCTERKSVPASVVKNKLNERLEKIEHETGRRPKGKHAKEIKEEVVHDLLPRAFPKSNLTLVWIDPRAKFVVIDATSSKKIDSILTLLLDLLGGGISLELVQTETSPAIAMASWLKSKEAPPGFSIDRECELKQPDSEKSTVRYARHTLDIDEVAEHIDQGKLPTQLAMTWEGRVSFVLTETMALKKIKLLDIALEGVGEGARMKEDEFDANVTISTGEFRKLIPDLIGALGGHLVPNMPPSGAIAERELVTA